MSSPRRIWAKINQHRLFRRFVALVIICYNIFVFLPDKNLALKIVSLVLQCVSAVQLLCSVKRRRRDFNLPGIREQVKDALRAIPCPGRKTAVHSIGLSGISTDRDTSHARISVESKLDPSNSVEDRLKALESNVKRLGEELSELRKNLDKRIDTINTHMQNENQTRLQDHMALKTEFVKAQTSELDELWLVAVCLLVGIILATFADMLVPTPK